MTLEECLLSVWRQVLVEDANLIEVDGRRHPVRRTARRRLRQVDFELAGQALRGIEQNPEARSRWARLAAEGAKVMQFTSGGRYMANVVDGKVTLYRRTASGSKPATHPGSQTPSE